MTPLPTGMPTPREAADDVFERMSRSRRQAGERVIEARDAAWAKALADQEFLLHNAADEKDHRTSVMFSEERQRFEAALAEKEAEVEAVKVEANRLIIENAELKADLHHYAELGDMEPRAERPATARWRAVVAERDEARAEVEQRNLRIFELTMETEALTRERDEARAIAEKWVLAEAACVEQGIRAAADALSRIQEAEEEIRVVHGERAKAESERDSALARVEGLRKALESVKARLLAVSKGATAADWIMAGQGVVALVCAALSAPAAEAPKTGDSK